MTLYNPKTKTLFKRGDDFKVTGVLTDERYSQLKGWLVTNKDDGCSTILSITPDDYSYHGRTANTRFSDAQASFMHDQASVVSKRLRQHPVYEGKDVAIYAELIGPGINGNKHELDEFELHVFDVRINGFWLDWFNMVGVCDDSCLEPVRNIGGSAMLTLDEIVSVVKNKAGRGGEYFEGVVARSDPYLYDNKGNRLMFKLKATDF